MKIITLFKKYKSLHLLLVALLCYVLGRLFDRFGILLETVYSSTLNKWFIQGYSQLTGVVPFSIGELLVITHFIAIPIILIIMGVKIKNRKFFPFFRQIISYLSLIYILFMVLWGFNYSRISVGEMMDLEVKPSTTEELYDVSRALILKANALRNEVDVDSEGVMTIKGGYKSVFKRADVGYEIVGEEYPVLSGGYGRPKYIILSNRMLYTGIVGIYFPFTAEANVNVATPILFTPVDTLHEMAHQRGFASEDEANYIAYLTATKHPDIDFQYSGTLFALTSTMNALWAYDPEGAAELYKLYSDGLINDLANYNNFWSDYAGEVSEVAETVNDTYLKGNGQTDGVQSYGRMVDLLLAHYRKYGDI